MLKRFFSVCTGMLVGLTLGAAAPAQTVTMYTVEYTDPAVAYTLGAYGPYQDPQSPSALIFGNTPTPGAAASEVAVEQHVLHPGDIVPLPHYSDGSVADESEVFWTVHLWQARFGDAPFVSGRTDHYKPASDTAPGDIVRVTFSGRTYGGGSGLLAPGFFPANVATNVDVMVTVVAVRSAGPTSAKRATWGDVKDHFRTP